MDFLNKLNSNASNSFEENMMNNENIINIICGVLLILLIVVVVYCLCRNGEGFSNKKVKDDSNTEPDPVLDFVTVLLVSRQGCGFAKRAEELFKSNGMKLGKHNVEIINISEVGNKLGKDYESKIQGTPALVNPKNGKVSMGLKSIEDYLKDLFENEESNESNDSNDSNNNNINNKEPNKELDILVVGYMGCPFCRKMIQFLDNKISEKKYKFIESNSDEGKRHMSKYKANGVPLVINAKNGKHINGYSEDLSQLM